MKNNQNRTPWAWVPTLYFAQGLPYIIVMSVATVIYKNLGLSNTDIALYTGWLYLPWVIKPFWSPFIDHLKTKRFWVVLTQIIMGALIASVGLTLQAPDFVKWSLVVFWLIAFSSATHDIAADGFYMIGLDTHQQSFFVGIRNTFWRVASITGQGGLVYLSGLLMKQGVEAKQVWMLILLATGFVYFGIGIYHKFIMPKPNADASRNLASGREAISKYFSTFFSFFKKKGIVVFVLFVLFYRLGEAQLTKLAAPFLLDSIEEGGLALSNEQIGWAYGTLGVLGMVLGGILGGMAVARHGLKFWLWPLTCPICCMFTLPISNPIIIYWHKFLWPLSNLAMVLVLQRLRFTLFILCRAKTEHRTTLLQPE